jgi:hypothetical protein
VVRHCLRIPFLVGQNDGTIIGNSCVDNPAWEVPCEDGDFGALVCTPVSVPEFACVNASFPEDLAGTMSLPEPAEKTVTFA